MKLQSNYTKLHFGQSQNAIPAKPQQSVFDAERAKARTLFSDVDEYFTRMDEIAFVERHSVKPAVKEAKAIKPSFILRALSRVGLL